MAEITQECPKCISQAVGNYNPWVIVIVRVSRKKLYLLDKLRTFVTATSNCFKIACNASKNVTFELSAPLVLGEKEITLELPKEFRCCVRCNYYFKANGVKLKVVDVSTDWSTLTLEVAGNQEWTITTIPAGTEISIFTNIQSTCGWDVVCDSYVNEEFDMQLQKIGACHVVCDHANQRSRRGGIVSTFNLAEEGKQSMDENHICMIDETLWSMCPVKAGEHVNNDYHGTPWVQRWIDNYGYCLDAGGDLLTKDIWKKFSYDLSKKNIDTNTCMYVNPTTRCCIEAGLADRCRPFQVVEKWSTGNTYGYSYNKILLPGTNNTLEVVCWNCVPEGCAYIFDSRMLVPVTESFTDYTGTTWPFIARAIDRPHSNGSGTYKHNYASVVWVYPECPREFGAKIKNIGCWVKEEATFPITAVSGNDITVTGNASSLSSIEILDASWAVVSTATVSSVVYNVATNTSVVTVSSAVWAVVGGFIKNP